MITGKAPGGDRLYGLTPQPLVGSRPVWPGPGQQPPFRPDVPCARDAVPDLKAPLLALTSSPRKAAPAAPSLLRRVERMLRRRAGR